MIGIERAAFQDDPQPPLPVPVPPVLIDPPDLKALGVCIEVRMKVEGRATSPGSFWRLGLRRTEGDDGIEDLRRGRLRRPGDRLGTHPGAIEEPRAAVRAIPHRIPLAVEKTGEADQPRRVVHRRVDLHDLVAEERIERFEEALRAPVRFRARGERCGEVELCAVAGIDEDSPIGRDPALHEPVADHAGALNRRRMLGIRTADAGRTARVAVDEDEAALEDILVPVRIDTPYISATSSRLRNSLDFSLSTRMISSAVGFRSVVPIVCALLAGGFRHRSA
jgi:hypothetical protein